MAGQVDVVAAIESHCKAIITIVNKQTRSEDLNHDGILKHIQLQEMRILDTCKVLREYRRLRSENIYIYDTREGEYRPASKAEKVKICRRLLEERGLIDVAEPTLVGSFTEK